MRPIGAASTCQVRGAMAGVNGVGDSRACTRGTPMSATGGAADTVGCVLAIPPGAPPCCAQKREAPRHGGEPGRFGLGCVLAREAGSIQLSNASPAHGRAGGRIALGALVQRCASRLRWILWTTG